MIAWLEKGEKEEDVRIKFIFIILLNNIFSIKIFYYAIIFVIKKLNSKKILYLFVKDP